MATMNSINSNIPIEISKGGSNATSMTTSYGAVYYDGSKLVTVASVGTADQVLTSNGAGVAPTFQAFGGGSTISAAFYAHKSAASGSVTGDGTVYTVVNNTELIDVGSDYNNSTGIFTAPSTTKYFLMALTDIYSNASGHNQSVSSIVTSNRTYRYVTGDVAYVGAVGITADFVSGREVITLADMDTSDTAYITIQVSGGSKNVGAGNSVNTYSGSELL